ncbi:DUF1156 domain-containing protein [Scytonema sp. UIC 10036]|uniref:DUF1156 domain-containing protein n=1 Tax=Scytonema sp. UIC 10036 TaxID=2304196 RepID=UPI0012DA8817|nr:DUF1156 domain-containing protein [Scytonema sp. UIC 10036]MUG93087.1 DUF1156 domain-containing protein [Scytonema sp. UIC 10036]
MTNDRRLIEDFIPIREISLEAAREKSIRKGHISTLHGGKKTIKIINAYGVVVRWTVQNCSV